MNLQRSWHTVRLSVKSLLMHPMRSGLTVLGILIGVTSVVWLLAIGEGISQASQEQISALGAKNIIVRTIKPASDAFTGGGYGVTRADYVNLSTTLDSLESVVPIRELPAEFRNGRRSIEGRFVGCTPEYLDCGTFFRSLEVALAAEGIFGTLGPARPGLAAPDGEDVEHLATWRRAV